MRRAFAQAIINRASSHDCIFLTGDLGFMAFEEVRSAFGDRFVNVGVAEQNMIGVAAGLAREGLKVFAYSIAPFCYARPYEQIRNDICLSGLPVCLVGNGGGYGYGHMGPTHHALEDCAAMAALGVTVKAPAFDEDLDPMLSQVTSPTYVRLGLDERPPGTCPPACAPWRLVLPGEHGALAALGPLAGVAWSALAALPPRSRPAVWAVSELGAEAIPDVFWEAAERSLIVIEEHVREGGLGMHIAWALLKRGGSAARFIHRFALRYPTGRYGSQRFHRAQCGLDQAGIRELVLGAAT
jgi:transketolase